MKTGCPFNVGSFHMMVPIPNTEFVQGIPPMEIEIGLGAEEMNVPVRHVVGQCRDEDRMSLHCRKLPHDGPDP